MSCFLWPELLSVEGFDLATGTRLLWPLALAGCSAASLAPPSGGDAAPLGSDSAARVNDVANGGPDDAALTEMNASLMDAAVDAAPSTDAGETPLEGGSGCPGLFCEDFEGGQIDPVKWDLVTGAG